MLFASLWLYNALSLAILIYNAVIYLTLNCKERLLCTITSSSCYSKIILILCKHEAQVRNHVYQGQLNGGDISLVIARRRCPVHYGYKQYVSFALTTAVMVINGLLTPSVCLAVSVTFSLVLSKSLS